jgi:hypothetical protein
LREIGLDDDAIEYLVAEQWTAPSTAKHRAGKPVTHWRGRRAELNGMTGSVLVDYIREKLAEHEVMKVVPTAADLGAAYARAYRMHHLNDGIEELREEAAELAADVPGDLARRVDLLLGEEPALGWDEAVARLAAEDREAA